MNLFDLAYLGIAPFFFASAGYKRWRYGKYRRSLPGMFGANLPDSPLPAKQERVWMHSVSVGETVAASAFFRVMKERRSEWEFLSTTTTETGQDHAKRILAEADYHDFSPVDLSWKTSRFLDRYRPSIYTFFETEIWPNTLLQCRKRRMPIFLVNGKLSDKSLRGYSLARPLLARPLSAVSAFLMQTQADADRMRSLVGDRRIYVTGNVKFDNLPKPLSQEERQELRRSFGVAEDQLLFLAGSTHPGEERIIHEAFRRYQNHGGPPARLVIAPRHPERFDIVPVELQRSGARIHRTSEGPAPAGEDLVVVLDEMGVLGRAFGAADVALVAGSWQPIGGHNLLEPAAHGVPVLHGPHMHAQKEIMRIMDANKASRSVREDLIDEELIRLAQNEGTRRELGENGRRAAEKNAGAAKRSVDSILDFLESNKPSGA